MLTFDRFKEVAATIPYQYRHPEFLYSLVKWLRVANVVEIGTHIGMTAVWLARALQEQGFGHLWCIDNFCWVQEKQEEQWRNNIAITGVEEVVTLIKGRSQVVPWPHRVDLAFVDGNHIYDVCKHDAEKAVELGAKCVILHDTVSWEGTRKYSEHMRLVHSDLWAEWDLMEVNFDEGLMIALKREAKGECRGLDIGEKWDVAK